MGAHAIRVRWSCKQSSIRKSTVRSQPFRYSSALMLGSNRSDSMARSLRRHQRNDQRPAVVGDSRCSEDVRDGSRRRSDNRERVSASSLCCCIILMSLSRQIHPRLARSFCCHHLPRCDDSECTFSLPRASLVLTCHLPVPSNTHCCRRHHSSWNRRRWE